MNEPSAYLITWPDSHYNPSVCMPKDLEHYQRSYEDAVFTPLYTPAQIGEAVMLRPAQCNEGEK